MAQRIDVNDLNIILDSLLNKPNSMIAHHIDSANTFYSQGILQIMSKGFKIYIEVNNDRNETEEERNTIKYSINIDIISIKLTPPETLNYDTLKYQLLTPNEACIKDLTYSSPMYVDAVITATSFHNNGSTTSKTANVDNYKISKIPVMVKSKLCNLYNKSKETLIQLKEDPNDIGGYFVIRGNEYIIDSLESMTFNAPREFRNIGHKTELTRGDLISKAGDYFENSTNIISRLLKNNLLTFEISNNKFKEIQIPFYLLFRAFGLTSDLDVMEHIMYSLDVTNPKIELMSDILRQAFEAKYNLFDARHTYNQNDVLDIIGGFINSQYAKSDNTKRYTVDVVLQILDKDVLPHIGLTSECRYRKIRYLGYLLNRVLLTYLEIIPSTDRDSYKNKRISSAGISYAKVFKTQFNFAVVNPLKKAFLIAFKNYNFNHIDLVSVFNSAINGSDFERALIQAITTGDKMISIKRTKVPNRLSSQQLHRKNQINVYSTLRNVNTSNTSSTKQSARANEMRRVHPSMTGYICCVQSADTGESVGMQKQMAISAKICLPNSSEVLKLIINDDPDLMKLDKKLLNETIFKQRLTKVFVNGDWLGCINNMYNFAKKYRNMRREQKINYLTTVTTDNETNEINFWVDVGRITRPLIIVYNNTDDTDYKHDNYKQWIKLNQEHLDKLNRLEITFDYLIDNQIVEYIAAEEQENILICSDLDLLYENETNPLKQFTHLDIAAAIIGIPGLTSPLANHNQVARVVFQTNQVKQTCGIPSMAWPFKTYKDMHVQYYNEMPLVKTIVNKYIVPTGANAIVAIAIYTGFNQEDSIIVNQSAVDRGLFTTSYFTFEKTELDKNEEFMTPNSTETEDMKAYSNYEKLVNGLLPIGTYVEYGDIIIGKVSRINKNNIKDGILYSDHSIVYKRKEPSYVWDVIISRNEESNKVCKIVFRSIRKCAIGDKFCLIPTAEVLTYDDGWKEIQYLTKNDKLAILDNGILKYENPIDVHEFNHDGEMYELKSRQVDITCTMNHKMYVKLKKTDNYQGIEAQELLNRDYYCKKNCINNNVDIDNFTLGNNPTITLNMNAFLQFLGIYLYQGYITGNRITFNLTTDELKTEFPKIVNILGISCSTDVNYSYIQHTQHVQLAQFLDLLGERTNRCLPSFVWQLSQNQCRILLNSILLRCRYRNEHINNLYVRYIKLVNDIQRLCIHAGYSSNFKNFKGNTYFVQIVTENCYNEPKISRRAKTTDINIINMQTKVYCPETSSGVFLMRQNGKCSFTHNSARSGQKATVGILLNENDMPFTSGGLKPDILFNPMSLPTRMTMGTLFEAMIAKVAAYKGVVVDQTMFKKLDLEEITQDLKKCGFEDNGTERLFNGLTGKYMDSRIFIGPMSYQKLQRFTVDTVYSHQKTPTDALTRQGLEGKSASGALRMGEMEVHAISTNSINILHEKTNAHADNFVIYICRNCSHQAIVNQQYNIYKCNYCKENADIVAVNSTWTAKQIYQELATCNVGVKFKIKDNKYTKLLE